MLDTKYASAAGIGAIATTLIGVLTATGFLTPEQGSVLSLHVAPVIGGIVAILGAFTLYHVPAADTTTVTTQPSPVKTAGKDPFQPH